MTIGHAGFCPRPSRGPRACLLGDGQTKRSSGGGGCWKDAGGARVHDPWGTGGRPPMQWAPPHTPPPATAPSPPPPALGTYLPTHHRQAPPCCPLPPLATSTRAPHHLGAL